MIGKKIRGTIMYIQNRRDGSKFKGCSPQQLSCKLTGKCNAVGYYSYSNRYQEAQERITNNEIFAA
jgi:hypothetical protein